MKQQRTVITGIGSLTAAGNSKDLWEKALRRECCLTDFEKPETIDIKVNYVGKVPFEPDVSRRLNILSRHARLAIAALKECIQSSGLEEMRNNGTGLVFSSASHGADKVAEVIDELRSKQFSGVNHHLVGSASNAGACHLIASHFKINGFVHSVEAASCSGMLSVLTAHNLIKAGMADRIFSVVGEANLHPITFLFYNKSAMIEGTRLSFFGNGEEKRSASEYVVPFSDYKTSKMGAIAEGSGAILIESLKSAIERDAKIYGEIEACEFFFHSDNYSGKDRGFVGLRSVIGKFKEMKIDSVYLPVTGCYLLDFSLYKVVSDYFEDVHTFTAEPVIGHTGAATAIINIILSIYSLEKNTLLPTKNLKNLDPLCKLKPSRDPLKGNIKKIMVVSAGWGGYNGACVIKKYE